jgi:DNA-directed RNA polymerase subunit omega
MNPDFVNAALLRITNPSVLINLVARRVRQLNSGGGGSSRPLVADVDHQGAADIALREIIEGKIGCEMPELIPLVRPTGRGRNRPKHWAKY